ncbi:MAG TPA: ClbS/DfsB family four-helix bundle protein [Candidatus Limnocylindrales bacterium]
MSLPSTRALLVAETEKQRDSLSALIAGRSREQLMWAGAYGWSAKDHVAHLAEWERLLFGWYDAGLRGEDPPVPAAGYTWATLHDLNQRIYERHRDDQLEHVLADWRETSRRLLAMASTTAEAELYTPGLFAWTGRGTLAGFVYECGPNHYRWSAVEIKRGLKVRR